MLLHVQWLADGAQASGWRQHCRSPFALPQWHPTNLHPAYPHIYATRAGLLCQQQKTRQLYNSLQWCVHSTEGCCWHMVSADTHPSLVQRLHHFHAVAYCMQQRMQAHSGLRVACAGADRVMMCPCKPSCCTCRTTLTTVQAFLILVYVLKAALAPSECYALCWFRYPTAASGPHLQQAMAPSRTSAASAPCLLVAQSMCFLQGSGSLLWSPPAHARVCG